MYNQPISDVHAHTTSEIFNLNLSGIVLIIAFLIGIIALIKGFCAIKRKLKNYPQIRLLLSIVAWVAVLFVLAMYVKVHFETGVLIGAVDHHLLAAHPLTKLFGIGLAIGAICACCPKQR